MTTGNKKFCVRPEGLGWRNIECFDRMRDALREATSLARSVTHRDQDTIIIVDTETKRTLAACATSPLWTQRRGAKRPVACHRYETKLQERSHLKNKGLFGVNTITISRHKITPTPGRNYMFAYKYIYDVTRPAGTPVVIGTDLLTTARRLAKIEAKKLGLDSTAITEVWKQND